MCPFHAQIFLFSILKKFLVITLLLHHTCQKWGKNFQTGQKSAVFPVLNRNRCYLQFKNRESYPKNVITDSIASTHSTVNAVGIKGCWMIPLTTTSGYWMVFWSSIKENWTITTKGYSMFLFIRTWMCISTAMTERRIKTMEWRWIFFFCLQVNLSFNNNEKKLKNNNERQ